MKITRKQIRNVIREYYNLLSKDHVDGQPWSGTPEDLADAQGNTWGHGEVVDPKGYADMVKTAIDFTKGKAATPLTKKKKVLK